MSIDRHLPERPPPAETWTHLALTAAIWFLLYLITPSQFIETDGPAGIITLFLLAVPALALSIAVWMMSPPRVQKAMLHLRWIVPVAFLLLAYSEKKRLDIKAAADLDRFRASMASQIAAPAAPADSSTIPVASEAQWPPKSSGVISGPLPPVLGQSETLIAIYAWEEEGRQLRFPIKLPVGSTPEIVVRRIQRPLDKNRVPLAVELDGERRLKIAPRALAPSNDRWFIGPEFGDSAIDLPPFPIEQ